MSHEACMLPARGGDAEFEVIQRLIHLNRIAVVGLSDNPERPSYEIAAYLLGAGKEVLPVNPKHSQVLGLRCYPSLEAIPGGAELVDVFRRAEFCPEIARSAVRIGAKGLWLQSGIHSPESRAIARAANLDFIEDRCLMVEMMRHK